MSESARHSEDFFKIGPLQGFTSKEPGPSLIRQAKLGNKEAFEFNHEMLGGLSMRDPQGSPAK